MADGKYTAHEVAVILAELSKSLREMAEELESDE